MDGKLFLGTARFLLSDGLDEAAYRSAVSRAYYACFLEMRLVAFNNCDSAVWRIGDVRSIRDIRHRKLAKYLMLNSHTNIQRLGRVLRSLLGKREKADYDMDQSLTDVDSRDAIDDAQSLLDDFSRVPPVEIGNAVAEFIRLHPSRRRRFP